MEQSFDCNYSVFFQELAMFLTTPTVHGGVDRGLLTAVH